MPPKRIKQVETPEGSKQRVITDFFKNSASKRELFIDDSIRPKISIVKGKFVDTASDDDSICQVSMNKVSLPYPIFPGDEDSDDSVKRSNKKKDLLPELTEDGLISQSVVKNINKDNAVLTMMQLNKPSTSRLEDEPAATSTPLKTITSLNSTKVSNSKRTNESEDLTSTRINTSSDSTLISESANVSILENIMLTPKNSHKVSLPDKNVCEGESPSKRSKLNAMTEDGKFVEFNLDVNVCDVTVHNTPHSSKILDYQCKTSSSPSSISRGKTNYQATPKKTTKRIRTPKKSPNKTSNHTLKKSPAKKRTKGSPNESKNSPGTRMKPEEEDEKLNLTQMELLKRLFESTLQDKDKKELLTTEDIDVIEEFLKLDVNHQYFLMKLFLYQPSWYNMIKFCSKIKLDQKLSPEEIIIMYEYHKNNRFVYTDLAQLSTDELLNILLIGDIKLIVSDLKLKKKNGTKASIIQYLKQNCKTQSTLTIKKSSEDVLKDAAKKKLGFCIKLREDTRSSFNKAYVLQTYGNLAYCEDVQKYLKDIGYSKIICPEYDIENFTPFKTKEQFSRFYEAILMKMELNKNNVVTKNLCEDAFNKLQFIDDDAKWKRHLPDYLRKFSAEYQYISILKSGIKKLNQSPDDVKVWLEFLIKNYPTNHSIGFWFKQLTHITLKSFKDYESAAKIAIEALEFNKKENIFDSLQILELNRIANKIRTTKVYKVCVLYCDQLAALAKLPVDPDIFPKKDIKGCTDRSGTKSGKRVYSYRDVNNEVTYGSVESIALKHYSDDENYEGIHCEGKFITILFNLLFWDIIYEYYVPMTFISKLQYAPLDMYSDTFYGSRKEEIDLRLKDIASDWSEEKLENFLKEKWRNHSHEKSIADLEGLNKELDEIVIMFHCINRNVLAKILGRLVTNYGKFRSGLPDLYLWNQELSECKFVEVKGEGDTLQPNQVLWIKHLLDVGAAVEVCHVSGVGAKKKLLKEYDKGENTI